MTTDGPGRPFPVGGLPTVRVDSDAELGAYLDAYPSATGPWRIGAVTELVAGTTRRRSVTLRDPDGGEAVATFESPVGAPGRPDGEPTTGTLDRLMEAALGFGAANPPHHPGSVPRFPVPSGRYPGRVEVPLAILAVERGERGLYAPPRVVVVDGSSGEPYAVGEFPGFDPDHWPPPRLGDWLPAGSRSLAAPVLRGSVARLSACLVRIFAAWDSGNEYPHRLADAAEVAMLFGRLDVPGMGQYYDRLNAPFGRWLADGAAGTEIRGRVGMSGDAPES